MQNRLSKKGQMEEFISISDDESAGLSIAKDKLMVSVTPHFFNLIDPVDLNCPIRKQVIPSKSEGIIESWEDTDPVGEESSMVTPGLVHPLFFLFTVIPSVIKLNKFSKLKFFLTSSNANV